MKMKRTRSVGKVLCLGMSYADIEGQIEKEGFARDILVTKEAGTNKIIECIQRNILTEMDGRDLARCIAMEKKHNLEAYTVSQEKASVYHSKRHLHANFSRHGFFKELQKKFGKETRFRQIILDYFWIPKGTWQQSHWKKDFFHKTIPQLANVLETPKQVFNSNLQAGSLYLPFCVHCITQIIASLDHIKEIFKITFVKRSQLNQIALWSGTATIDRTTMQEWLGKEKGQEEIYCTFQPRDFYEGIDDPSVSKEHVLQILRGIEDFEEVRMIRLQPLTIHEKRSNHDHGGFVDLMDPKFIAHGFDSLPGARTDFAREVHLVSETSETDTDEQSTDDPQTVQKARKKPGAKRKQATKRRKATQKTIIGQSNRKKKKLGDQGDEDSNKEDNSGDSKVPLRQRLFTVVDDLDSYERLGSGEVSRMFEIKDDVADTIFPYSTRNYSDIVSNNYLQPPEIKSAPAELVTTNDAQSISTAESSQYSSLCVSSIGDRLSQLSTKTAVNFYQCCHPIYEQQMKKMGEYQCSILKRSRFCSHACCPSC